MASSETKETRVASAQNRVDRLKRLSESDKKKLEGLEENYNSEKARLASSIEKRASELTEAQARLKWLKSMPVSEESTDGSEAATDESTSEPAVSVGK